MEADSESSKKNIQLEAEKKRFSIYSIAPMFTAVVAIISVIISNCNVSKTLDLQNERTAIDLYDKYYHTQADSNYFDIKFTSDTTNWSSDYSNFAQYTLFLAESIYVLRKDVPEWNATLKLMIGRHMKYYLQNDLLNETLNRDFVNYCYETANEYHIKKE